MQLRIACAMQHTQAWNTRHHKEFTNASESALAGCVPCVFVAEQRVIAHTWLFGTLDHACLPISSLPGPHGGLDNECTLTPSARVCARAIVKTHDRG